MATNPFNPAAFQKQEEPAEEEKKQANLPYEVTGNTSRDQVRKMFWEIFTADSAESKDFPEQVHSCAELAALIEAKVFESTGSDQKTKQYRDMSRQLQLKLKVSSIGSKLVIYVNIILLCRVRDMFQVGERLEWARSKLTRYVQRST